MQIYYIHCIQSAVCYVHCIQSAVIALIYFVNFIQSAVTALIYYFHCIQLAVTALIYYVHCTHSAVNILIPVTEESISYTIVVSLSICAPGGYQGKVSQVLRFSVRRLCLVSNTKYSACFMTVGIFHSMTAVLTPVKAHF